MDALRVEHYIGRASDFYQGLELLRDADDFRHSSALLAIHSAISYSDALRTGLGEERLDAEDHRTAMASLRQGLVRHRVADFSGFTHFEYLMSMKSFVAYGGERLDERRSQRISLAAERFANWAWRVAKNLAMEGWSDENSR